MRCEFEQKCIAQKINPNKNLCMSYMQSNIKQIYNLFNIIFPSHILSFSQIEMRFEYVFMQTNQKKTCNESKMKIKYENKPDETFFHFTFNPLINQIMLDMSGQELIDLSSIAENQFVIMYNPLIKFWT